jgi:ubiquinol-cytochrome c reductase cytochrome b subunit
MFSAIVILFFLPYLGKFTCKSSKFLQISQFFFWCFVFNLIFLGWLGACVVEPPYIFLVN